MKNTIMGSHDLFCDKLKESVKSYTVDELIQFIEKTKNIDSKKDYFDIYNSELRVREIKKT